MAMFLVSAKSKTSSLSVGVPTAAAALVKAGELETDGFQTIIFLDIAGRERTKQEMENFAADDIRNTSQNG